MPGNLPAHIINVHLGVVPEPALCGTDGGRLTKALTVQDAENGGQNHAERTKDGDKCSCKELLCMPHLVGASAVVVLHPIRVEHLNFPVVHLQIKVCIFKGVTQGQQLRSVICTGSMDQERLSPVRKLLQHDDHPLLILMR